MDIYTLNRWTEDGSFSAVPGQEIAADVYGQMLDCMPPYSIPGEKAQQALRDYGIPVHAGFLMGEPHSNDSRGPLYMAFGMNDYGKGKRYYYLGLSHRAPELNGRYYFMDCMNAFVNGGLFPAADFKDDADAISAAANYEATLYKIEYKNGERISSRILYEPRYM